MNNTPRTEARKSNLINSLREQIKGLLNKKQNLKKEQEKIDQKIQQLKHQQSLYEKQEQEISLLIENFTQEIDGLQKMEIPTQDSNALPQDTEARLRDLGLTLDDYRQGRVPPTICRELNLKVITD